MKVIMTLELEEGETVEDIKYFIKRLKEVVDWKEAEIRGNGIEVSGDIIL